MSELMKEAAGSAGFSFEPPPGGTAEISSAAQRGRGTDRPQRGVPCSFGSPGLTDSSSTFVFGSSQCSGSNVDKASRGQSEHRGRRGRRRCARPTRGAVDQASVCEGQIPDEVLFREPPREDCPVCFLPLPLPDSPGTIYQECCGKLICGGCAFGIAFETYGRNGDLEADVCPFCREPRHCSDEEKLERLKRRMEIGDAHAHHSMADLYHYGEKGLASNEEKAFELNLRAGELGCAAGFYNAGLAYFLGGEGVEMDKKKAWHYWELAAVGGDESARCDLGRKELVSDNIDRAMKHFVIAVKAGCQDALDQVKELYMEGRVEKDEYAMALRAFQTNQEETRSERRDIYASFEPARSR